MRKASLIGSVILYLLLIYFIAGYIIYPLIILVKESLFQEESWFAVGFILYNFTSIESITNTLLLSVISVIGSCIIGTYLAYIIHFKRLKNKSIISSLILIPIATPPIIGTVAFLYLVGDNGILIRLSELIAGSKIIPSLDGWTAIIIVHLYSFYAFFYLFLSASLKKLDHSLVEASYTLGANKVKTFFSVILPHLFPAIIGASLLVFMASMASFSAPFIFGGNLKFITTSIYYNKINGDTVVSSLFSLLLVIISLISLIIFTKFRKKTDYKLSSKGTIRIQGEQSKENAGALNIGLVTLMITIILLPLLALLYLSLIPEGALLRNIFKESLTLANYINLFKDPAIYTPFLNSFKMALVTVALCMLIGLIASLQITKGKSFFSKITEIFISLPYGIPGTVIALTLILSFNTPNWITIAPLVGTFIILPIAYTIRNIPLFTQSTISGLNNLDKSLEEASYSLGANKFYTFRKIIFPLILPSIINGSLLVFINSMGEFVSTILLYNYATRTVSIEIYSQLRMYNTGAGAVYGILLFAFVIITVYITRKYLNERIAV
ncbi:MAG TPA: iron ABC transporter permease [Ignavibacteria bacterium]|nr:iron ABC transporter permease [Ignavibacteria bacterium]